MAFQFNTTEQFAQATAAIRGRGGVGGQATRQGTASKPWLIDLGPGRTAAVTDAYMAANGWRVWTPPRGARRNRIAAAKRRRRNQR